MHHALSSLLLAGLLAGGCARAAQPAGSLPTRALLASNEQPALYLGPEPNSAQIGYLSDEVTLELLGPAVQGRVPVQVTGGLQTSGYVAADQLSLRVQHRGRVRGTPVYVGPNDRVRVLGDDAEGRLRVEVTPRDGEHALGRFEGSYPRAGLAVEKAAPSAELPPAGVRYRVPAQTVVPLLELPGNEASAPRQVAELGAQSEPYDVTVVRAVNGWLAVRAGTGPSLIGWTSLALVPSDAPAPPAHVTVQAQGAVPTRLANERGALRKVAAGTEVKFGERVIGRFREAGFARVQQEFAGGFVDVFAAVDDMVALRGIVRAEALQELP